MQTEHKDNCILV